MNVISRNTFSTLLRSMLCSVTPLSLVWTKTTTTVRPANVEFKNTLQYTLKYKFDYDADVLSLVF